MYKALILLLLIASCSGSAEKKGQGHIVLKREKYDLSFLQSCFEPMNTPGPGDWLYSQEEQYITFDEYTSSNPRCPDPFRNTLYIQPLGDIDTAGMFFIHKTKDFFENFFGLKVIVNKKISASVIPKNARRNFNHNVQLKTKYILYEILEPEMPLDAIAFIALTDHDLYPADDWNFVFGQASVSRGVGVWSYFHFGNPSDEKNQLLFLTRLLKTAGHETCHMFSIKHCVSYKCLMNGSNSLYESDHHPSYLCYECLQKLCYCLKMKPEEHFARMQKFWSDNNSLETADFYKTLLESCNY